MWKHKLAMYSIIYFAGSKNTKKNWKLKFCNHPELFQSLVFNRMSSSLFRASKRDGSFFNIEKEMLYEIE